MCWNRRVHAYVNIGGHNPHAYSHVQGTQIQLTYIFLPFLEDIITFECHLPIIRPSISLVTPLLLAILGANVEHWYARLCIAPDLEIPFPLVSVPSQQIRSDWGNMIMDRGHSFLGSGLHIKKCRVLFTFAWSPVWYIPVLVQQSTAAFLLLVRLASIS